MTSHTLHDIVGVVCLFQRGGENPDTCRVHLNSQCKQGMLQASNFPLNYLCGSVM